MTKPLQVYLGDYEHMALKRYAAENDTTMTRLVGEAIDNMVLSTIQTLPVSIQSTSVSEESEDDIR